MDRSTILYLAGRMLEQRKASANALPSVQVMQTNILHAFLLLSQDQYERGVRWYDDASTDIYHIASELSLPFSHVCAMTAAGSWAATWEKQRTLIRLQAEYIAAGLPIDGIPGPSLNGHQKKTMHACIAYGPVVLTSPKWSDFCQTLLGDKDISCVDRHIGNVLRGCYVPYKRSSLTLDDYKRGSAALAAASNKLTMRMATLGACMWIWARETKQRIDTLMHPAPIVANPDGSSDY